MHVFKISIQISNMKLFGFEQPPWHWRWHRGAASTKTCRQSGSSPPVRTANDMGTKCYDDKLYIYITTITYGGNNKNYEKQHSVQLPANIPRNNDIPPLSPLAAAAATVPAPVEAAAAEAVADAAEATTG